MSSSENTAHLLIEGPFTVSAEVRTSVPVDELEESNDINRGEELVDAFEPSSGETESLTHEDSDTDYSYYDWSTDEEMYVDYDIDGILVADDIVPALRQNLVIDARRTIFRDDTLILEDTSTTAPFFQSDCMAAESFVCNLTPSTIEYIEYYGEFVKCGAIYFVDVSLI